MLKIHARNDDGVRLEFTFENPEEFIRHMNESDDCIADVEILMVALDGMVLYSSLGKKVESYDDTLRTMNVYDWFS